MPEYEELELAREEMRSQSELYRPSVFWEEASSRIAEELRAVGVERFRSMDTALGFFVPRVPGNGFTRECL